MKKIIVTQVKSAIRKPKNQKRTLIALGLRKLNNPVEHDASPAVLGMVKTVNHLVSITEA